MATVLDPLKEATQTVILHNVSWNLYEHLLAEHEDVCNPRFAYDRGVLQIMVTLYSLVSEQVSGLRWSENPRSLARRRQRTDHLQARG